MLERRKEIFELYDFKTLSLYDFITLSLYD